MTLVLLLLSAARATYPPEVAACLDLLDVACADRALSAIGASTSSDPDVLAAAAHTRFYDGDYPEAYDAMAAAVAHGFDDRFEELPLYERTMYATAGWVEEVRGRFAVRFRPGIDALLVDDAFAAIQGSDRSIAPLLGGSPPGISRVELFPDGRSFIAASSLNREDVDNTGVVGLAKWSRLLVTSPRALPKGYPWQDTIAHEYIHLVVAHHTRDRAPVWLQEAIAKYLDARWRDGRDGFHLTVRQQGLLADALANDNLVTFAEMHPSLAKLPTADRAGLAYAQLATLMQFCFQEGGEDVLQRTLPRVAEGVDALVALAQAAGFADGDALFAGWRTWIDQQPLHGKQIAQMPTMLDGGDEMEADPVLAEREDLARFVTLGDLLHEAGFAEASLIEYAKAIPHEMPSATVCAECMPSTPPTVTNRIARVRMELGDSRTAKAMLEQSLVDYPEFGATHATLGELYLAADRPGDALASFDEAVAINPFDADAREGAVKAAKALGDTAAVARNEHALRVRARGGDDIARVPIHTRTGTYELPSRDDPRAPPEE